MEGVKELLLDGVGSVAALSAFVGSKQMYPRLAGAQIDLYRSFIEFTWAARRQSGVVGLVHYDTHMTERGAGTFRAENYHRLRRHWHFKNELRLFEIGHQKDFGVSVFGGFREEPSFLNASMIFHPDTISRSFDHDGSGPEPGIKDLNDNWDVRPHAHRIGLVDAATLKLWQDILGGGAHPALHTSMVYVASSSMFSVLAKAAAAPRIGRLRLLGSSGWGERGDVFENEWGAVNSWDQAILQGPFLYVATPFYQSRNSTMKNKQDWSRIDLEALAPNEMPITSFKRRSAAAHYRANYTDWGVHGSALDHYRIAWRRAAANAGERTLIPALIPPGTAHVDFVSSMGMPSDMRGLVLLAGQLSSIVSDLQVRILNKDDIRLPVVEALADASGPLNDDIVVRALKLNCVTQAYAELWNSIAPGLVVSDWTGGVKYKGRSALLDPSGEWSVDVPLRRDSDRRQALLELDAIIALHLGLSADELCGIYRSQFPVLAKYDRRAYLFDAQGRQVPTHVLSIWRKKRDATSIDERTHTNASGNTYVYELPFVTLDREADMRTAYAHFEKMLAVRSNG